MRITFVLPYAGLAGGIRVLAIYANRLHERGHTVTVVSIPKSRLGLKKKISILLRTRQWPSVDSEPSHFDVTAIRPHVIESNRAVVDDDVPDADVVIATFWKTGALGCSHVSKKGRQGHIFTRLRNVAGSMGS